MGKYTIERGLKYELYGNKKTTQKRAAIARQVLAKRQIKVKALWQRLIKALEDASR